MREHREEKASKAVTLARRIVREAEDNLSSRKKAFDDYKAWRLVEEERLIQSIMRKPVKLGDITDLRLEISTMHERELDYQDQVTKAEGELDRARQELAQAQKAYREATQNLQKLLEHRELWQREQSFEAERLADLELEDFTSTGQLDLEPQMETSRYELN